MTTCEICDTQHPSFSWTDTHGIAQCYTCGTPYTILHYEGEGDARRRVDKEPECIVAPEWKPVLRAYWEANGRRIPSGCSFSSGQELATAEDQRLFSAWAAVNRPRPATEVSEPDTSARTAGE